MTQTVLVTDAAIEYTWPTTLTELAGADISGDAVAIGLGTWTDPPAVWADNPVITHPTPSSVTVQMLIDSSIAPGTYYVWVRVTDSPEIVPRRGHQVIVT